LSQNAKRGRWRLPDRLPRGTSPLLVQQQLLPPQLLHARQAAAQVQVLAESLHAVDVLRQPRFVPLDIGRDALGARGLPRQRRTGAGHEALRGADDPALKPFPESCCPLSRRSPFVRRWTALKNATRTTGASGRGRFLCRGIVARPNSRLDRANDCGEEEARKASRVEPQPCCCLLPVARLGPEAPDPR